MPAVAFLAGVFLPVLVLAATALILGRTLRRDAGWAFQTALGLALLAHGALLLGFAGLLKPVPVLGAAAAIHLLGLRSWREGLRARPPAVAAGVGIVIAAPFVLFALYPPTGFDETLYHLPFARAFAASGGIPFLTDLRFPVFPQANEILFALTMLFGFDVAAHGVQLLMALLTAAILVGWGREAFPELGGAAGWIAAALFLGNPIVASLAGSGYVEPGLTLFATAALDSARRFRRTGERGWLVLAAVFAGTAADVKYLGLYFLGVVALAVVFSSRPIASRVRDLLLFGAVAAVVVAPWYGRMLVHTGNPLFPFFPQIFGSTPWNPLRFHSFAAGGTGRRLIALVRLPWDVVFTRERFGFQPPYSPVWPLLLPVAALAAFRDSRFRHLLGVAGLYAFACLFLPPDSRYLLPVLPLVSLAVAGLLVLVIQRGVRSRQGCRRSQQNVLVWGLCAAFLLPGWAYAGYRIYRQGPIPLTPEAREAYLTRRLPVYPAVAFLNRTHGSDYTVWAMGAERMVYHARGRLLGDWIGIASFSRVLGGVRGPEDLHRRLRSLGAGYLLIPDWERSPGADLPFPEDAAFRRWFRPVYSDAHARVYALAREER